MTNNKKLISHSAKDHNLKEAKEAMKNQILKNNDTTFASIEEQLDILEKLEEFEFGRFLIKNRGGWNGYWTHYVITFPDKGRLTNKSSDGSELSKLESFILNKALFTVATQQRFKLFLKHNNECVKEEASLASVPCGLLGDLLFLDYKGIEKINILGIDLDKDSLIRADELAITLGLKKHTSTVLSDAWHLPYTNKFDLLSCNGLNFYEPDKNKVFLLYKSFFYSLKRNGKLVTSYIGYPPGLGEESEWDMTKINQENMRKSSAIFVSVIGAIWLNFTTKNQMTAMLKDIGYKDIKIEYDNAHIFPTVVAYKRTD